MVRGQRRGLVALASACIAIAAQPASAGSFSLFGAATDYKLTLGYAAALRMEKPSEALINGPVDQLFIQLNYPPYRWNDESKAAFQDYIEQGRGGWIGFHHAISDLVIGVAHHDAAEMLGLSRGAADRLWAVTKSWLRTQIAGDS